MAQDDNRPIVLTPKALVPAGLAVVVFGGVLTFALQWNSRLANMENNIARSRDDIADIKGILTDRVTFGQFEIWTELLQADNPGIKVRPPRK